MSVEKKYRIERDSLGEKEVPADAYYGVQTCRAIENFSITGYRIHWSLIKSLAIVKKACAMANMDVGLLDKKLGLAVAEAAQEIIDGNYHEQFIVDPIQGGAGTSINMNANEVITNVALLKLGFEKGDYDRLSPNTHVNMSQSTNDVFPTAVHIAVLIVLEQLLITMDEMLETFRNKSKEFDHIIKMGRTHLQDAVPIRLGQEFEAYSRVLESDIKRIRKCDSHMYEVNIGATAVGTGLNADPKYIAYVIRYLRLFSGYPIERAENLVDATQNTDEYTEVSAALKVCMMNMSKIANDLRLMSSGPRTGLGEINLPHRQPGSSIMPGKVNPVMAELINQVAFQVIGNDNTICLASESGQLELNVMEPVLRFNLLQSITIMRNAFNSFNKLCLAGITANDGRMKEYVEKSVGILTAINPHVGYETASRIANEALRGERSLRQICLDEKILTEEELDIILDPYEMTKLGISGINLLLKNKGKTDVMNSDL